MNHRTLILGWIFALAVVCAGPMSMAAMDENTEFYVNTIKPLLKAKCYSCHGAKDQEAALRLDTASLLQQGGDSGPAIVPHDAAASRLLTRVTSSDPDQRMPPDGQPLTAAQIAALEKWIAAGAKAPENERPQIDPAQHWAFQPLKPAKILESGEPRTIDSFVRKRITDTGLKSNELADATTLIRRMYLDLHGLPPTPDEISQFKVQFAENRKSAIRQLIDRLLASPRYGERWAQHWLDVVRYADTHGFEVNTPRPNAWPYRDYVIESLNADKPYDQFVFEQLAGDTIGRDAATGFLVAAAVLLPGQIGKDEASKRLARQDALDEMVIGTTATFLGLTVGCARCHDHKFDPITQTDYYTMQAFFAGVEYGDRPLRDAKQEHRKSESAKLAKQISTLTRKLHAFEPVASTDPAVLDIGQEPNRKVKLRDPVDPAGNIERLDPILAKHVRFTITATSNNNQYEPCIDELEVFSAEEPFHNVALAEAGTKPSSSGNRSETGQHQLKHINDGQHGNGKSWISNEIGQGWVQLEFPRVETIDRIEWARDRTGKFKDRLPVAYKIEVSQDGQDWTLVAGSHDRLPMGTPTDQAELLTPNSPQETQIADWVDQLKKLKQRKQELDRPRMVFAGQMRQPDPTHVLLRGDPEQPGKAVDPQPPVVFESPLPRLEEEQQRRIALANWIIHPENPLTARVIVNRVWQYHFGRGLVTTPSDFGLNGAPPSHPELLDWLAVNFIENGWSLKELHRMILSSATYQQSNQNNHSSRQLDADNRLLSRFALRRLEAEAIRDSMLFVSGQLNLKMGGPGFNFFQSRGGLSGFPPVEQFGADQLRRMVYAHKIRMEQVPVFGAFDCPDAGQPAPSRSQSTTAIQALNLFNSPFVTQQADRFAEHLISLSPQSVEQQIELAFRKTLGRKPTEVERAETLSAAHAHGLAVVCRALFNSSEFLFIP